MVFITESNLSIKLKKLISGHMCTWGDPKETGNVLWWAGPL